MLFRSQQSRTSHSLSINDDTAVRIIADSVARELATADQARTVWFSDSSSPTRLVYSDKFKYNPSSDELTVASITGKANTATTADKVANSLTIKLNSGSTDGTNMWTFNGSASKSVDITPGGIGAATSGHTHNTIKNDLTLKADDNTYKTMTAGSFYAKSDARLKENFKALEIEKSILNLPTYKFDFINGSKNQIGCKAQDLQEICPEIVSEGEDGYLSINESKIVYLLLEEVKKLRNEIDELKRG